MLYVPCSPKVKSNVETVSPLVKETSEKVQGKGVHKMAHEVREEVSALLPPISSA